MNPVDSDRNVPPAPSKVNRDDDTAIPNARILDPRVNGAAYRVYSVLLVYAQEKGWCYPSFDRLAADTGYSKRAIDPAIRKLERAGWIAVDRHKRVGSKTPPNIYYILTTDGKKFSRNKDRAFVRFRETHQR